LVWSVNFVNIRRCIQKFPYWVDNEITTTINTRWEATQRVMAAKLTRLTHKIAIKLHLVAELCTICNSRCWRPVRKLLDTPSYLCQSSCALVSKQLRNTYRSAVYTRYENFANAKLRSAYVQKRSYYRLEEAIVSISELLNYPRYTRVRWDKIVSLFCESV
jgi:hypothetical protein